MKIDGEITNKIQNWENRDQKESPVLFSVLNKSVIGQNDSKEAGPTTGSTRKSHTLA